MMLCVICYWVLSGAKWRQIQQLRCCVLLAKLLKWRNIYLKLTRHNGRAGTHGTYNPKHNDRSFNLANSEHIDPERAKGNIYWDCFHGFRSTIAPQDPDDLAGTFSDVERQFYETHYSEFIERQNERNAKIRHTERNRSIPDLLSSRKTCPEETIYQLGTKDDHASGEVLLAVVTEFIEEFKARFGDHVHVLDWALHLDESTPHIHERHVFDCENRYREVGPQQEKALEALGFVLPDPDKPLSRRNNRKITFDAACRKMLFEIAKRHGLELEEEAEYGNRQYLEKQDYILAKQKEQLAAQQSKVNVEERTIWDEKTMLAALQTIENPALHLAVHLSMILSLREGEILGLQPSDLDFDAADGRGTILVNKTMQRANKDALEKLDPNQVYHTFPDRREGSKSSLITQDLTPAAPQQPPESKQPETTKITGKAILEAIRLMDADERRELTRVLFA